MNRKCKGYQPLTATMFLAGPKYLRKNYNFSSTIGVTHFERTMTPYLMSAERTTHAVRVQRCYSVSIEKRHRLATMHIRSHDLYGSESGCASHYIHHKIFGPTRFNNLFHNSHPDQTVGPNGLRYQ